MRQKTEGCTWGYREGLTPAGAENCWAGAQGPRKSKKNMVWGGWLQRDWALGTHRGNDRVNDQGGQYTVALAYHPSTPETKRKACSWEAWAVFKIKTKHQAK